LVCVGFFHVTAFLTESFAAQPAMEALAFGTLGLFAL